MNFKNKMVILFLFFMYSVFSCAYEIPQLGDANAVSHQTCGKHINLQFRMLDDNFIILGLKNKKTGGIDLFKSVTKAVADNGFFHISTCVF